MFYIVDITFPGCFMTPSVRKTIHESENDSGLELMGFYEETHDVFNSLKYRKCVT